MAARALTPRLHEAPGEVALAPAVAGGVDGDGEGGVAVVDGAPHPVVDEGIVAAHVELEDAEVVRGLRHGLEPGMTHTGQHLRDAELRRRLRGGGAAARGEGLHRADRREHHRDAHGPPEERRADVDLRHVAEHARPERDRVEGQPIAAERRLGLGAADQIVPLAGGEAVLRRADDLVQGLEAVIESRAHGPRE